MRSSLPLLIITTWAVAAIAQAQTAATQQTAIQPAAAQPAAAPAREPGAEHPSRSSPARHSRARRATDTPKGSAAAAKAGGVLALGATDITGNKELPKVMVIVPWKDSLGADGVVKPTDSLLDEVLEPVDRSVFQRRIHYYKQLNAAAGRPADGKVAPVGDSH